MKDRILISYSSLDIAKVELIEKTLESNEYFQPLVIARQRESLKPLANKVAEGIQTSAVVLPILTSQSIDTQWINQEVGYATALEKKIMPIVERGLLGNLKGFIHREMDLPYIFTPDQNKAKEHKDFVKVVRSLIADLESTVAKQELKPQAPAEQTEFEKTLDEARKVRGEQAFRAQKERFLRSDQGLPAAEKEFQRLVEIVKSRLGEMSENGIMLTHETADNRRGFTVLAEGFSLTFGVDKVGEFVNEQDIVLFIRRWRGHLNRRGFYPFPESKPVVILEQRFTFDLNSSYQPCWLEKTTQYTSEHLVELSLTWLTKEIVAARRTKM